MTGAPDPWDRARAVISLLSTGAPGLGGLWLRARSGPARDAVLAALRLPGPVRRIAPSIGDEQLYGGLDLEAALAGAARRRPGVLEGAGALILTMAERAPPRLVARLGQALDRPGAPLIVALDEGAEPEEALAPALADRLAFFLDLDGLPAAPPPPLAPPAAPGARPDVDDDLRDAVTLAAARLGVASLRAPLMTLAAAGAAAAARGAGAVEAEDARLAVELVLAHRAAPGSEEAEAPPDSDDVPPPPNQGDEAGDETRAAETAADADMLVAAAAAALPADLLARLAAGRDRRRAAAGSGAGARRESALRGRPAPSRPGAPRSGARLDLLATLRAAAPWQRLRAGPEGRLKLRKADFRIRRHHDRRDRLLIFLVDASGSAARARLAEAKGAVELLLAEAYVRRDHVALIAFRGQGAETVLPPTRSLVMTKRRLGDVPGGGGTPLAAGLREALTLALSARSRGMTPCIVLLSDGRANVTLEGAGGRAQAAEEAAAMARLIAGQGVEAAVIDMGRRPEPALGDLAALMGAPYVPLPHARAEGLSAAVSAAVGP